MRKNKEKLWEEFYKNKPVYEIGKGYVYVLKAGKHYKIGVTYNLKSRIDQIQNGNPLAVKVIYVDELQECSKVERDLQKMVSDKWIRGEWFKLDDNDLFKIECVINEYKNCT